MKVDDKILLGHIHGLFGVKGWVKVFSYTRPRSKILDYPRWFVGETDYRSIRLEDGKAHKEGVIAKLSGIDDRDAAVEMLHNKIWVNASELPELTGDEYYWYQLIGLQVVDTTTQPLGEIIQLFETGANDVLVVKSKNGSEHLVPYIKDRVIKKVDLDNNLMIVDWDTDY